MLSSVVRGGGGAQRGGHSDHIRPGGIFFHSRKNVFTASTNTSFNGSVSSMVLTLDGR